MQPTVPQLDPGKRVGKLKNLRAIMEKRDIRTNVELSEITGIPTSFIDDLVRGSRGASYRTARKIARNLGIKRVEELTGKPLSPPGQEEDTSAGEEVGDTSEKKVLTVGGDAPNLVAGRGSPHPPRWDSGAEIDLSPLNDLLQEVKATLERLSGEISSLRSEQADMKAKIDRIDEIAQNPPKRSFFGG